MLSGGRKDKLLSPCHQKCKPGSYRIPPRIPPQATRLLPYPPWALPYPPCFTTLGVQFTTLGGGGSLHLLPVLLP